MDFRYWDSPNGKCPAWDFILNLPDKEKVRLLKKLEAYQEYPVASLWKSGTFKKVEGMVEIRVLLNGKHYRLFGSMEGQQCVLFYGFVKKSKKIPQKNLKAAENNFEQYKDKNQKR